MESNEIKDIDRDFDFLEEELNIFDKTFEELSGKMSTFYIHMYIVCIYFYSAF